MYKRYKSDLYVLREGRFVKLPPKKKKVRKIDWRVVLFVGLLLGGMLLGHLIHSWGIL